MKKICIAFMMALAITSCGSKDSVKAFIPGTYVGHFETEYSRGNDTLFLNSLSDDGNNYSIIRKVAYRRIKNKKALGTAYKTDNWIAVYNPQTKVLYENQEGTVYSFAPEKQILYRGNSIYHKIKN